MRKHLLTGLVILLPVALTLWVISFLFDLFTEPLISIVGPLVQKFQLPIPESLIFFIARLLSLIFLCIFIFVLGVITQVFLIQVLMDWANRVLFRIPFFNTVYKVTKDIFQALFSTDGKKAFKKVVLIPFPLKPIRCLGFETGEVPQECIEKVGPHLVAVFAPTAPHPISGFLFLAPREEVHVVDMSTEEAVKFLVSGGMIVPESKELPNDRPL